MDSQEDLTTPIQDKRRLFLFQKRNPHPAPEFLHSKNVKNMEETFIPLETKSQGNIPVAPSETEGNKGKRKRHSESLITTKRWTPIATQRTRKSQNSASIKDKPTLIVCTGKITVINPVLTSKGKFPKAVENKFLQGALKGILKCQETDQRTDKDCSKQETQELDTLDRIVDGKTLREIIPTLPFTFQFNRNLKPEDWKAMDQVIQLHQLLKDLFKWGMENKRLNLASHWEEIGASFQKICLKEIPFKDLMVITKAWIPHRQFKLLEERATRIKATIQAIEEQLNQTEPTLIPSDSQGVGQPNSPVASKYSGNRRSVAKSHHYSQSQGVSRRRQGYKGKNNTSFSHRKKESDPMIQKLLHLVK
ncbi:hypothetical protein O181_006911 [Austropuccinia psidii MF-1]|uniref:Uncharacterized protein n=1 Tax=Austropuccinia psidii MF-1 TaxID=1389203 RepID=A0A9Q3BLS8_9BASI|nr:hypothetical protein [Austropuccinia psidii MF-1]